MCSKGMEGVMNVFFGILLAIIGIYSFLIFIRIIISWFGGSIAGKPVELLFRITDPYLNWWRNHFNLRIGFLDLSPIAGIAFLSLLQSILNSLSRFNRISLGNILAIVLLSAWSVASFILGFCLIIIVLRLIAYLTNRDVYNSPFWSIINSIGEPLLYRTNRFIFGNRLHSYLKGIILSLLLLVAIRVVGEFAVAFVARILAKFPI